MGNLYWEIPLASNSIFTKNVQDLIACEKKTEELLGNRLKRRQTNFIKEVIQLMYDSNDNIKKKLIESNHKLLDKTIPYFCIIKAM